MLARGILRPDPRWLERRPLADGPRVCEYRLAAGATGAVTKVVLEP